MDWRDELSAMLDGELSPERADELRRRIETDPEVAREYESLQRTIDVVRGLPRASAPADLRARLASSLLDERATTSPLPKILSWRPLALAASALVAVGLGLWTMKEPPVPGQEKVARKEWDLTTRKAKKRQDAPVVNARELDKSEAPGRGRDDSSRSATAPAPAGVPDLTGVTADKALEPRDAGEGEMKRGAKKLGGKSRSSRTESLRRFERVRSLPASDRAVYFSAVSRLSPAALRAHFDRIEKPGLPVGGDLKAKTLDLGTFPFARRSEAELVASILRRVSGAPRAKSPSVAMNREERIKNRIQMGFDLSRKRVGQLRTWLDQVQATTKKPRPALKAIFSGASEPEHEATVQVSVVLTFPKP